MSIIYLLLVMKCCLWTIEMNGYKCESSLTLVSLLTSTGEDVLQSDGHHRRVSGAGQWSRRGLQTETSHTLASVHWTGLPGDLLDLHGEFVHLITVLASQRQIRLCHTLLHAVTLAILKTCEF